MNTTSDHRSGSTSSPSSGYPDITEESAGAPGRPVLRYVLWTLVAAVLALWAVAFTAFPFGRDQGILAWAGEVVLHGGYPYRDAWEVKGPMAILPFTLAEFVFGHHMWGIRVLDLGLLALGTVSASVFARRVYDNSAAVYVAFLFLFVESSIDFWMTAQPDAWAAYVLTAAVALLITRHRARWLLASAGVGLCTLEKPVYAAYLLLFAPVLLALWRRSGRLPWKQCLVVGAGFLAPIAVCLLWLQMGHAVRPFVETFIGFNMTLHLHSDQLSKGEQFRALVNAMRRDIPFSVGMALAVLGGVLLTRRNREAGALYWTWLALGFLVVIVQRKYFLYQWYPAMCAVATGSGLAVRYLRDIRWRPFQRLELTIGAGTMIFLWLCFVFLPTPALRGLKWVSYVTGRVSQEEFLSEFIFITEDYFSFPRLQQVSNYIDAHTSPSEHVVVWGFDPLINYLSRRSSVTRFGYHYPLLAGDRDPQVTRFRSEFMRDVTTREPAYIAIPEKDNNALVPDPSDQALHRFPEFDAFVHQHYRREKQIGDWELWRRIS